MSSLQIVMRRCIRSGWDFGDAPPGWRPSQDPQWLRTIDADLDRFRRLGISVVRWFILADGLTYGSGASAPRRDFARADRWRFDSPSLDDRFLDHFELLLRRFANVAAAHGEAMQLLPVLIDFHFCDAGFEPVRLASAPGGQAAPDPAWVKQGRADAITEPPLRATFLDRVLEPLLELSTLHRQAIYAWDLMNEPEWVTNGWHPDGEDNHPVDEPAMRGFLEEGQARVRAAGLLPTVGFALADTLNASAIVSEINQFHHYPGDTRTLGRHRTVRGFPTILGEIATSPLDVWPELPPAAQTPFHRLSRAERCGAVRRDPLDAWQMYGQSITATASTSIR